MMIELPEKLEAALKVQANANGGSPAGYVCEVLERDLASTRCAFRGRLSVVVQFGFFLGVSSCPRSKIEPVPENRQPAPSP